MLTAASAPQIRVTTLEETDHAGELLAWSADEVVLRASDQNASDSEMTFAHDDLLRVEIRTEPTGVSSNQGVQVELVDGSILAGTDFRSTEQTAWIAGAVLP
ncbi:MAG: hypothetical protein ACR2NU_16460, partial [Aeoliella sp.]